MTESSHAFAHPANVLVLNVFRLNGALVALGDAVVGPMGLTSARWQVMGAIAEAQGALPVAGLARTMGLVRQSVQRVADDLALLGLVRFAPNPHHRRAQLVQLTEQGAALFDEANARWGAVADMLVDDVGRDEMAQGAAFLRLLRERVEALHSTRAAGRTEIASAPDGAAQAPQA